MEWRKKNTTVPALVLAHKHAHTLWTKVSSFLFRFFFSDCFRPFNVRWWQMAMVSLVAYDTLRWCDDAVVQQIGAPMVTWHMLFAHATSNRIKWRAHKIGKENHVFRSIIISLLVAEVVDVVFVAVFVCYLLWLYGVLNTQQTERLPFNLFHWINCNIIWKIPYFGNLICPDQWCGRSENVYSRLLLRKYWHLHHIWVAQL